MRDVLWVLCFAKIVQILGILQKFSAVSTITQQLTPRTLRKLFFKFFIFVAFSFHFSCSRFSGNFLFYFQFLTVVAFSLHSFCSWSSKKLFFVFNSSLLYSLFILFVVGYIFIPCVFVKMLLGVDKVLTRC